MFGLFKDFAATLVIIILNHWVYGIEDDITYNFLVSYITKNQSSLVIAGVFLLIILLGLSAVFEEIGLYKITYGMSKILVRLCQFFITFLCTLNIIFFVVLGDNFLFESGYLTIFLMFIILGASCWTIRVNDFNYHTMNAIVPIGTLAVMSILLVGYIWPAMGF